MTTKLNLTLKEATVRRIKIYAEKHKLSVSKIAEDYFEKLTRPKIKPNPQAKFSERAAGIIDDIDVNDISSEREKYLKEKHGLQNFSRH